MDDLERLLECDVQRVATDRACDDDMLITVRVRVDDAPEEPVEVPRTDAVLRALRTALNIPGTAQLPSLTVDRYL